MTRDHWRLLARGIRTGRTNGLLATINGTYWSIGRAINGRAVSVRQSIIRDQPPTLRVTNELGWAAHYRKEARNMRSFAGLRATYIDAARACIAGARTIRLESSAFWRLP